ncbi:MAG: polyphosphate polymerase domain-containing protein [Planctomycetes bacterium]|nr:polyphosphate polymerase domain-containing protein [Planctomycetota bacterium]
MTTGDKPKPVSSTGTAPEIGLGVAKSAHGKDTTLACRYELKYRIPEAKARAIAEYVKSYIHMDRYAKLQPRGEYPIVSLYLDSDGFRLARETLEGKKNRFKLRIRGYSDNPESPCFFEVKRRINEVILKSRARVRQEDISPILQTGRPPSGYKGDAKVLRQFLLYTQYIGAKPMVLVRYMRQAFEGDSDNRVRVTFDRQIYFKISRKPKVELNSRGWQSARLDCVVLEIKFTAKYPAWLSNMVKVFDLKRGGMSKYASSVKKSCDMGFCAPQAYSYGTPQLTGYLDG